MYLTFAIFLPHNKLRPMWLLLLSWLTEN